MSKQTAFMDQLIDLVHIRDSAEDPKNKSMQSPGMVRYSNFCMAVLLCGIN